MIVLSPITENGPETQVSNSDLTHLKIQGHCGNGWLEGLDGHRWSPVVSEAWTRPQRHRAPRRSSPLPSPPAVLWLASAWTSPSASPSTLTSVCPGVALSRPRAGGARSSSPTLDKLYYSHREAACLPEREEAGCCFQKDRGKMLGAASPNGVKAKAWWRRRGWEGPALWDGCSLP